MAPGFSRQARPLFHNAHGAVDMALALGERLIDARRMIDQAPLKHLQRDQYGSQVLWLIKSIKSVTVVLEPPPSSSIALHAPAAAMSSAISAKVAPNAREQQYHRRTADNTIF